MSSGNMERRIQYSIVAVIGTGTYGEVEKAKQIGLDRWVAVKKLRSSKQNIENLKREAWIQGDLTHPNIVSVYDFDPDNGVIVLEYVENNLNNLLREYIKRNSWIKPDEAIEIIEQCLEALAYAHEKGVIHGDVKPKNILISESHNVKLSDFGVAKSFLTAPSNESGSENWAAPETLRTWHEKHVWSGDNQSDLFSVGVIGYLLLCRRHPFMDRSGLFDMNELILDQHFIPLKMEHPTEGVTLPEKYIRVIMRLLAKERSKRYTSAREALIDLHEEESIACSGCGDSNRMGSKYCSSCGISLQIKGEQGREEPIIEKALFHTEKTLFHTEKTEQRIGITEALLQGNFSAGQYAFLAYQCNSKGLYSEAEAYCTKAIEIESDSPYAYQTRGFARSRFGKFKEAVEDFSVALNIIGDTDQRKSGQLFYQRGYAKLRSNNKVDACKDARKALEIDSSNPKYRWLVNTTCGESK